MALPQERTSLGLVVHPSRTLIIGKSQAGKTTLAIRLAMEQFINRVDRVIFMCSTLDLQEKYKEIAGYADKKDIVSIATDANLLKVISSISKDKAKRKTLLFIDDQSSERAINTGSKGFFSWLIYNAVWMNTSIICACHKVTAVSQAMRENVEHIFLLKMLNPKEVQRMAEEFNGLETVKEFKQLYRETMQEQKHAVLHGLLGNPVLYFRNLKVPRSRSFVSINRYHGEEAVKHEKKEDRRILPMLG